MPNRMAANVHADVDRCDRIRHSRIWPSSNPSRTLLTGSVTTRNPLFVFLEYMDGIAVNWFFLFLSFSFLSALPFPFLTEAPFKQQSANSSNQNGMNSSHRNEASFWVFEVWLGGVLKRPPTIQNILSINIRKNKKMTKPDSVAGFTEHLDRITNL